MQNEMSRLQKLGETMTEHGTDMALALVILIVGLLVARLIDRGLRKGLRNLWPTAKFVTTLCNVFYIVLVALVVSAAAVEFGAKPVNILRLLTILSLVAVGLILFFRPFMPTMPFKVGETVKAGNLLGKVEAMTFLNTRLRTFDGKTFFVPNRQILNDVVINYQFSGSRRIKIDLTIRYDEDLLKAKRAMEAVMTEDARVKTRPGPMVYVLKLAGNGVELGGRCWVHNKDYWVTRCDLTEKIKLRFDRENLRFALPQLDLHMGPDPSRTDAADRPIDGALAGIDAHRSDDDEHELTGKPNENYGWTENH